jgi:hypothetical protein
MYSVSNHHNRNAKWDNLSPHVAVALLTHAAQIFRMVDFRICQPVFVASFNADQMPDMQRPASSTQFALPTTAE